MAFQAWSVAIDADIPNARARLDKMIDSLEAYVPALPETQADIEQARLESVWWPGPDQPTVHRIASDPTDFQEIAKNAAGQGPVGIGSP